MGVIIGILADQCMGRQRTTMQTKSDIFQSCNYAQEAFPSGLDKMGVTLEILADRHMGRQKTTMQTKPDICEGHVIMPSEPFPAEWTR